MSEFVMVKRELLEDMLNPYADFATHDKLRAVLAQEAGRGEYPEGRRERFQKWVLATKHPVLGYLDGHWLERGDDREGYANEYVQGLWVAFKEFAEPPAPVSVVHTMKSVMSAICSVHGFPTLTSNQCHALAEALNKVKELNQ